MREALAEIRDDRPFFETEHGPIHTFKDHRITLPATFDDEYFRHMQWAHLAAGGSGGGMRWPNRNPHSLTPGMREAQRAMAAFLPLIDWVRFRRQPVEVPTGDPAVACIACADGRQAVLFLLRTAPLLPCGRVDPTLRPGLALDITVLGVATSFDTVSGQTLDAREAGPGWVAPPFGACLAVAVR